MRAGNQVVVFSSCRRIAFAVATCLALLLVFLPVSVSSMKAAIANLSTNTNSEENHEEQGEKETESEAREKIVVDPGEPTLIAVQVANASSRRVFVRSVAYPIHPSQYGVRRLL
jgi:hypothetical protein